MNIPDNINQPFSWLEINSNAIINNIKIFREIGNKKSSLGVVLKSNAYGHGLLEMVQVIHKLVDIIYVSDPLDGKTIREYEKSNKLKPKRVVILSVVTPNQLKDLSKENIEFVVYGKEWNTLLESYKTNSSKLMLHLHIDTGLGREGFSSSKIIEETSFLKQYVNKFEILGVMSHFSNTEDVTDQAYANKQLNAFNDACTSLVENNIIKKNCEKHFAASAASLILKESRLDTLRIGISLYGLWPSDKTKVSCRVLQKDFPKISPVMSWLSKSQTIKELEPGDFIGYGCTYKCETKTKIAVLPVGYFDGYPRLLSNKAHVLINGKRCPILGRVMMNHIVVNISSINNSEGGVIATLIGKDGNEEVSADMLAEWAETINYEAVTRIGSHIKRFVV